MRTAQRKFGCRTKVFSKRGSAAKAGIAATQTRKYAKVYLGHANTSTGIASSLGHVGGVSAHFIAGRKPVYTDRYGSLKPKSGGRKPPRP